MRILYLPNEYSQQRQKEKPANIYPVLMAMEAQWYRDKGHIVDWVSGDGEQYDKIITKPEGLPFLELPAPDRVWSSAKIYKSGNYKYLPGTHILSAIGCWHGKCTFCVERRKPYEVRNPYDVILEIVQCYHLGFKEIFDDSATFPIGEWLEEFCSGVALKIRRNITLGCNMRTVDVDYKRMRWAGFRMLLFGLESANQITLDKIQKGTHEEDVKYLYKAAKAGLDVHVAVMFGYHWETDEDAIRTLHLVHALLRKGIAKTAQASFYSPMGGGGNDSHRKYVSKIYDVCLSPHFWFNQIKSIKNEADIKYLWRKIKTGIKEWR